MTINTFKYEQITVMIPVYEQTELIATCIDSVTKQSFRDFSVVCFADPSDSDSVRTLSERCKTDKRISLRTITQPALAGAVDDIIAKAKSKYVMFVHPGDYLESCFIEVSLAAAAEGDAQVVICNAGRHERLRGTLLTSPQTLNNRLVPSGTFSYRDVKGDHFRMVRSPSWLSLFDREFLKDEGIAYFRSGKDDILTGRCALTAAKRISAVRAVNAYMHNAGFDVASYIEEMHALYAYLNKQGLYESVDYRFAHSALLELSLRIREFSSDERRYTVLDHIRSDDFKALDLLGREKSWYRYKDSIKEESFIRMVLQRYERSLSAQKERSATAVIEASLCSEPAVSVIMPVYNSELYLKESVSSVLNQTLRNIELICVDDGSTDAGAEILAGFAQNDNRVTILHQENSGVSAARNRGIEKAKGKYIYFIDSDDLIIPDALETAYKKAEEDDLEAVFFNGVNFYDERYLSENKMRVTECGRLLRGDFKKTRAVAVWLFIARRDFLVSHGLTFHEGIIYEDTPYSGRLCAYLTRWAFIDRIFYKRRIRPASITTVSKSFDHSYGYFAGACDLTETYYELKDSVSEENRDELLHRIAFAIYKSREYYMLTPKKDRGEEYGLLSDLALFRSMITLYCYYFEETKDAKTEISELREKLKKK